jgi:hypothetical protein
MKPPVGLLEYSDDELVAELAYRKVYVQITPQGVIWANEQQAYIPE